ncbi:MAG: hypothetical protein HS111_28845 [Kofleriaceae bacterium]|nr:hypothetical protein [Kofleriaceae bacterium]
MSDILEDFAEALWADCADAPDDQHEKLDKMKSGFDRLAALAGHTAPAPPPH